MRKALLRWLRAFLQPRVQLAFHLVMAVVWLVTFWPGMTVWRNLVPFVVFCSIYANFVGHLSAIVAGVGARKADLDD